jgi:nicotinamide phosphoribosyltransferase
MIDIHPLLLKDFYKVDHRRQYPHGLTQVYSNLTARMSRVSYANKIMPFGMQAMFKEYFIRQMQQNFFELRKDKAIAPYKRVIQNALKDKKLKFDHIADLHDVGFMPLYFKAIPEGSLVDMKIPFMTSRATNEHFAWLVNMFETLESTCIWQPSTSATTAFFYRQLFERFARETGANKDFVKFQAHDFSMRGMPGVEAACMSAAGHLLSNFGTDTIPAIPWLEHYYNANSDNELIGTSVYATEHSVMSMEGPEGEFDIWMRLLTEEYPDEEILSVVSDTYNLWRVLTEYLPKLKEIIMKRSGKLVIRPDSGDPELILCGDPDATPGSPESKGVVELLWEEFGGTYTDVGYKSLDPHIGAIYGDSITPYRAESILNRLKEKRFASDCVVLGIGSYTYQYVTRDTFGTAMKATYAEVNGVPRDIFKDPITDGGKAGKKSAKGLLKVIYNGNGKHYELQEQVSKEEENEGCLLPVFKDGVLLREESLADIRARVESHLEELILEND